MLIFQALFELAVFGLLLGNGLEGASDDRHPEAKKALTVKHCWKRIELLTHLDILSSVSVIQLRNLCISLLCSSINFSWRQFCRLRAS